MAWNEYFLEHWLIGTPGKVAQVHWPLPYNGNNVLKVARQILG